MTDQSPAAAAETLPLDDAGVFAVLSRASTAAVSDVLDMLGYNNGLLGIRPLKPGHRVCGPAFTVAWKSTVSHFTLPSAQ